MRLTFYLAPSYPPLDLTPFLLCCDSLASTSRLAEIIATTAQSPVGSALRPGTKRMGLSRSLLKKTAPLHQSINPAPKRLEKAPEKKVRPKKSDLNEEDFDEEEWAEMEKERRKREMDWEE